MVKGSVAPPRWGGAARGRQALGFYRYLFLETNTTPQTGARKELAIKTHSSWLNSTKRLPAVIREIDRWMFFLKTQLVCAAAEPPLRGRQIQETMSLL